MSAAKGKPVTRVLSLLFTRLNL